MMHGFGYWGGFGGWGIFNYILMLAFWILVIVGIVFLIKYLIVHSSGQQKSSGENPLDILKRRYAKGEISKEEFEKMKKDLLS